MRCSRPGSARKNTALTTLALISVWQFVGIPMMLIYAALLSIPDEVIEAAEMRRHHRLGAVLEDQAAADPAGDRHHLDPDLRRQFQRLRPDLLGAGRAGRAELLDRHPRHLPLPHLLRLPAAARRPVHGRDHRLDDVPHHPGRRLPLPLRHPDARCAATSSEGGDDEPSPLLAAPHRAIAPTRPDRLHADRAVPGRSSSSSTRSSRATPSSAAPLIAADAPRPST